MLMRCLSIGAIAGALAACGPIDSMKNAVAQSQAVSNDLDRSLGLKSFVGFNWNNGSLTSVTVTFDGIPENGSLRDVVQKSRQAILAEFQQAPQRIVIAFSVAP
jgi:hypothetical protein